jgi:hypothetical protein
MGVTSFPSNNERNLGLLTDVSRAANSLLGDNTGRTISLRTAQGFKNTFNLHNLSDDEAMDIVHLAMLGGGLMLNSKNPNAKLFGSLLGLGLVALYHND